MLDATLFSILKLIPCESYIIAIIATDKRYHIMDFLIFPVAKSNLQKEVVSSVSHGYFPFSFLQLYTLYIYMYI